MLDWLIIGGGIHGTYMANLLVRRYSVPLDKLAIIDPHDSPCMQWKILTCKTGMTYLRSPIIHHVDLEPDSIKEFMARGDIKDKEWATTQGEFNRPSLRLFNEHINHIVESAEIHKCYRVARALGIRDKRTYLKVDTTAGTLNTRRVLLAISPSESTRWPDWARKLKEKGASVRHVFDDDFWLTSVVPGFTYAVIGKGLSAQQLALACSKVSPGKTYLLSNGRGPIHKFDADPCFLGPRCLEPFGKEKDLDVRRRVITEARKDGSAPREVATDIIYANSIEQSLIIYHQTAVNGKKLKDGRIELTLASGDKIVVDRVVLATGFEKTCPGSAEWLAEVIDAFNLPLHTDGYPIVDQYLRWTDRIFVTGALGELEIGPVARNIFGATLAGVRIGQYMESSK